MPIKCDELMALKNLGQKYAYGDREVMLYAYGIGMGADPMDEKELAFVNEATATPRALRASSKERYGVSVFWNAVSPNPTNASVRTAASQ